MSQFVAPPSALLMQIANDPSIDNFKASLVNVRNSAINYCNAADEDFYSFENILDFGCGVGRFLFAFDGHLGPSQKLFGCDLNQECAQWCKENIAFAEIEQSSLLPPLPYADNSIDYINAVSVFTHLTVDLQFQWAWEIHRILRPGGVIAFTTNGLGYIPFLLGLSKTIFPVHDYRAVGTDGILAALSEGGTSDDEGQRAVVTFHSQNALKDVFYPLEMRHYQPLSTLAGGQAISVMKKTRASKVVQPMAGSTSSLHRFPAQKLAAEFRCYLSFEGDAYHAEHQVIDYAITSGDGRSLIMGVPVKTQRIFAGAHLVPLDIPVPAQTTDFTITLSRQPGSSLPPMQVNWPHLISLNQ